MILKNALNLSLQHLIKRYFQITSIRNCYHDDNKTTVTILNKNFDYGLMVDNISEYGFILNNGIKIIGPMIIFPKTVLSWNVANSMDMNSKSFSLFLHLEPKLDIIVIGLDDDYPYNAQFIQNIRSMFKDQKILTEILPIHQACSTFNFLNAEHRYVAAALIPPKVKNPQDILVPDSYNKLKNIEKKSDPFYTSI